jgi:rod shape-determining protein MreD
MSLLIAAVGAVVAAILESSVLTQLLVVGVKPDLVLALAIGAAMVTGFEEGMLLAFLGGLTLDMLLPERPVGSTTLTLLAVVGLSLLVARATEPTRLILIAGTAFVLTFLFQALLLALLALTAGVGITAIPVTSFALGAVMNALLAVVAGWVTRAFMLRFGPAERAHW